MLRNHTTVPPTISSEELVMLQRLFDEACARRGLPKNSSEAMSVAEILMDIFQSGIRAEPQLRSMLSGARSYP